MVSDRRQRNCDKDKFGQADWDSLVLQIEGKKKPSIYQLWIYAGPNASLDKLIYVFRDQFMCKPGKAQDMALKAINEGKVMCCTLPKDVAQTKEEEVNSLCSTWEDTVICVAQKGHAEIIRKM